VFGSPGTGREGAVRVNPRRWLGLCAALVAGVAGAQPYPVKPIRMIIPAGPGGGVDTVARAVGQRLAEALGQPVVFDNRPGAGTMIGSELTAKSPPDGYTVLMVTNSHAINASLYRNLKYDPVNDFAEVTLAAISPYLLLVHPSVPVGSVKDLIALAKRRPGDVFYGSAGNGSATHLAGALFASMAAVTMVHVPYKGGGPAVADLLGGHVQVMFNNVLSTIGLVKAGRLRALAATSARRLAVVPELPTVAEAGLPGYESGAWYGVLVPARTPQDVVARLNREIVAILKGRDVRQRLENDGAEPVGSAPEEFAAIMRKDIAKWAKVVAATGMRVD
jgi:tripartite-type tricarboxylate transporter receptor subunit TctC